MGTRVVGNVNTLCNWGFPTQVGAEISSFQATPRARRARARGRVVNPGPKNWPGSFRRSRFLGTPLFVHSPFFFTRITPILSQSSRGTRKHPPPHTQVIGCENTLCNSGRWERKYSLQLGSLGT